MAARQHGAKAMIVVTGPNSPNAGELAPMTFDTAIAGSGIVAVSVTGQVANQIFAAVPDKPLATAQKALDDANPHATGFALPDVTARVHAVCRTREAHGPQRRRVSAGDSTGRRRSPSPGSPSARTSIISATAKPATHWPARKMRARSTSAPTTTRRDRRRSSPSPSTLSKQPRKRNVLVGFWSGEELGLIGSNAFSTTPPVPLDAIAAYLNFDMVGRMQDNKLTVQAAGSSPAWGKIIEQANVAAGFDLVVQEDPYQPTDVATFNAASIPSLSFFTGTHGDYHKPSDTPDKIDYEDLDRVVDFAAAIARRLEDADAAPAFTKVDQQLQQGAGRAGVRLFTGHDSRLLLRGQGTVARRRRRRRPRGTGRLAERRCDRRNRRADDRQHLRLHLCARRAEDRPAGEGVLSPRRETARDDADTRGEKISTAPSGADRRTKRDPSALLASRPSPPCRHAARRRTRAAGCRRASIPRTIPRRPAWA